MKKFIGFILLAILILGLLPHAHANARFGNIMAEYFVRARVSDEVLENFGLQSIKDYGVKTREHKFHEIFSEPAVEYQVFAQRAHIFEQLIRAEILTGAVTLDAINRAADKAFTVDDIVLDAKHYREFLRRAQSKSVELLIPNFEDVRENPEKFEFNVKSAYAASRVNTFLFGPRTLTRWYFSLDRQGCTVKVDNDVPAEELTLEVDGEVLELGLGAPEEVKSELVSQKLMVEFVNSGRHLTIKKDFSGETPLVSFLVTSAEGEVLKSCVSRY